MDLISGDVMSTFLPAAKLYKHSAVKPSMFNLCSDDSEVFRNISANTPDSIVDIENHREVLVLEVGCTFDYSLEEAFSTKILKYQQLVQAISQLGYRCTVNI